MQTRSHQGRLRIAWAVAMPRHSEETGQYSIVEEGIMGADLHIEGINEVAEVAHSSSGGLEKAVSAHRRWASSLTRSIDFFGLSVNMLQMQPGERPAVGEWQAPSIETPQQLHRCRLRCTQAFDQASPTLPEHEHGCATLKGFEVMRMIHRGHCMLRHPGATGEIRLVNQLFGLIAWAVQLARFIMPCLSYCNIVQAIAHSLRG